MSLQTFDDQEFGSIRVRRIKTAKYVRVRVLPGGIISATMPQLASIQPLRKLINESREALRSARADMIVSGPPVYHNGDSIGSSHRIELHEGARRSATRRGQVILWTIPTGSNSNSSENQERARKVVRRALDAEAKAYLPRRLSYLAETGGFLYSSVRYSNAKGRWGSCSNRGVISLNVALMNIPKDLIDYVLVHELSHTRHLNHSEAFWQTVASYYPDYKTARKSLKRYSPYL